jgi:hypothetical protein
MKQIYSLLELPNNITAVYAYYCLNLFGQFVTMIGTSNNLKEDVYYALIEYNKESMIREFEPEKVTEVRWWEIEQDDYKNYHKHTAALKISKSILKPRIAAGDFLYEEGEKYYKDKDFSHRIASIFNGEPNGIFKISNKQEIIKEIDDLRLMVSNLLINPEAEELGIFNSDEKQRIIQNIWTLDEPKKMVKIAYQLANDCLYEELKLENQKSRRLFALAMGLGWLGTKMHEIRYNQDLTSALAVLIGKKYQLNIDAASMYKEIYGEELSTGIANAIETFKFHMILQTRPASKPTIPYNEHNSIWPEFNILQDASIQAKKALIYITYRVGNHTRFVSLNRLPNYEILKVGIKYLVEYGLINCNPTPSELLGCLTYKELSKFALDKGITLLGNKKDLIHEISSNVNDNEIGKFIKVMVDVESPVRPKIGNLATFYKFILEESWRLYIYQKWIAHVKYYPSPEIMTTNKSSRLPGDYYLDVISSNTSFYDNPKIHLTQLSAEETQLFEKYWDNTCNDILEKTIIEYKNKIPIDETRERIFQYFRKIDSFSAYKREITGGNPTSYLWVNLINHFILLKLLSNKYYQLGDSERICNGCNKNFIENSVQLDRALRVDKNIRFCDSCYKYIFSHPFSANNRQTVKQTNNEMLDSLKNLSKAIGGIPLQIFMEKIPLNGFSDEKQIEIGRILLKMPSYSIYVDRFGSWLNSLVACGILDGDYLRTIRGVKSVANDGHVCLSLGERSIDDWLNSNNIHHKKEPKYPFEPILNPTSSFRADWIVYDVYIEFSGMMEDYSYAKKMRSKELLAAKLGIRLVIILPEDLFNLEKKLGFLINQSKQ